MGRLSSVQNASTGFTPQPMSSPIRCSNANGAASDALHSLMYIRNSASFVLFVNHREGVIQSLGLIAGLFPRFFSLGGLL